MRWITVSLQANRKTFEGKQHPDRNLQFEFINLLVEENLAKGNPVISVNAKKKELVGNFKNVGREWRPKVTPEQVNVYDFLSGVKGLATPYGVYDIGKDEGWVNVGADKDTAFFCGRIDPALVECHGASELSGGDGINHHCRWGWK